jgi:transposase-like protein
VSIVAESPSPTSATSSASCKARSLGPEQRQALALAALQGDNISQMARRHEVSRQFLYHQRDIAQAALDRAFSPEPPSDEAVLFHLPVTRSWLRQFVLCATLIGHSSLRAACEMLETLLDFHASLGWAHSVVADALSKARSLNAREDLSLVRQAALDEMFQTSLPVLSVVDVRSAYCCLLGLEEHRDADTWGVRLLELADRGFAPSSTVADFALGLRAGQTQALPGVPCKGDVFHALFELGKACRFLENRAYRAIALADKLTRNPKAPQQARLEARSEQDRAIALADDVLTLCSWLRRDVLSPGRSAPFGSAGAVRLRREGAGGAGAFVRAPFEAGAGDAR